MKGIAIVLLALVSMGVLCSCGVVTDVRSTLGSHNDDSLERAREKFDSEREKTSGVLQTATQSANDLRQTLESPTAANESPEDRTAKILADIRAVLGESTKLAEEARDLRARADTLSLECGSAAARMSENLEPMHDVGIKEFGTGLRAEAVAGCQAVVKATGVLWPKIDKALDLSSDISLLSKLMETAQALNKSTAAQLRAVNQLRAHTVVFTSQLAALKGALDAVPRG